VKKMKKDYGVIFDMDNTVIRSDIDFPLMNKEAIRILEEAGINLPDKSWVSRMAAMVKNDPLMTDELWDYLWRRMAEIEFEGLKKAALEPGIVPILEGLNEHAHLFLLTNNVHTDAETTLKRLGVDEYFDILIGRGMVPALKPAPDGIFYILKQFPHIKAQDCIAVGDALNDIQSAHAAGIDRFVAYVASHAEDWSRNERQPLYCLQDWNEESLARLLQTLKKGA
jgi:phosphoglycolate phosphatase